MLLSDRDILAEIDAKRVGLEPFEPDMVQPSSIDVRLDRFFRVFENHRYLHIDPAEDQPDLTRMVEPDGEEPFILHPGEFVPGSTYEVVTLPDDVAARLEGKSSLGRLGLLTHSTAGFIDPGFSGHVTLELSNVATLPIKLWPGMKIGQLCFFRAVPPSENPYGPEKYGLRYQGQRGPTRRARTRTSTGTSVFDVDRAAAGRAQPSRRSARACRRWARPWRPRGRRGPGIRWPRLRATCSSICWAATRSRSALKSDMVGCPLEDPGGAGVVVVGRDTGGSTPRRGARRGGCSSPGVGLPGPGDSHDGHRCSRRTSPLTVLAKLDVGLALPWLTGADEVRGHRPGQGADVGPHRHPLGMPTMMSPEALLARTSPRCARSTMMSPEAALSATSLWASMTWALPEPDFQLHRVERHADADVAEPVASDPTR